MIIHTKNTGLRRWFCYGTIQGMDMSYRGQSMEEVQCKMREYLIRKNISAGETTWTEPQYFEIDKPLPIPEITYQRHRIDFL